MLGYSDAGRGKQWAGWSIFAGLTLWSCAAPPAREAVELRSEIAARFATQPEAAAVLGRRDDFIAAMSPFDRSARLSMAQPVSEEEFLAAARAQALPWEPADKELCESSIRGLAQKLEGLDLRLPHEILLVRSTGREEAGAPHTRGTAIVFPSTVKFGADKSVEGLLAHELFHVMTRNDGSLRAALYRVVGFEPCEEIALPPELASRKITNPDAPRLDCRAEVRHEGRQINITPLLLAKSGADPTAGLFPALEFRLLVVERQGARWVPELAGGQPRLLDPAAVPAYHELIGANTRYIIHPEEVLADNFVLLITGARGVATPRVLEELAKVLGKVQSKPEAAPPTTGG